MKRRQAIMVTAVLWLAAAPALAETKILFIGKEPDHPHGTHMYMHTGRMLAECLALTDGVESVVSQGWPQDERTLEGVDAVVVYATPAAELLLDGPQRKRFAQLMESGVGLTTIHWASSVRQENFDRLGPKWLEYLGGTWISNVGYEMSDSPLQQLQPNHPICRGWKPFPLHDEFYKTPTITDEAEALLQVTVQGIPGELQSQELSSLSPIAGFQAM